MIGRTLGLPRSRSTRLLRPAILELLGERRLDLFERVRSDLVDRQQES